MTTSRPTVLLDHLCQLALLGDRSVPSDAELLEAILANQDDAAFAAIVRRHGPMVLGVCRRVLHNHHDAEDAFQATFLVLARKAASVKPRRMVGNWLHGVAYRTALEARTLRRKRHTRESGLIEVSQVAADDSSLDEEIRLALDRELNGLPDHYRVAIVLCDLEGMTQNEAARHLACPVGTVGSRLTRGRALLAKRLAGRGVTLSCGALAAAMSAGRVAGGVPNSLIVSTLNAVAHTAIDGMATSIISPSVAALTERVVRTMLLAKLKIATVVLVLVLCIIGIHASFVTNRTLGAANRNHRVRQNHTPAARAEDQNNMAGWTTRATPEGPGTQANPVLEAGLQPPNEHREPIRYEVRKKQRVRIVRSSDS